VHAASDPRLTAHATGTLPAWLWQADGARILWANSAGADVFGARSDEQLRQKTFGPADPQRRQIARLAGQLKPDGAIRLERLRGFGAAPGMLATCSCSRFDFPDGRHGVLVVAAVRPARGKKWQDTVEAALVAAATQPAARPVATKMQAPAPAGEALAELALFDAFTDDNAPVKIESEAINAEAGSNLQEARQPDPPHVEASREPATPIPEPRAFEETASPAEIEAAEDSSTGERHHPLRFKWQTDRDERFSIDLNEFLKLIGPLTEACIGRPWHEIAGALGLDPDARMQKALASHDTFSGITLNWPVDGGYLLIELSGVPTLDAEREFAGYQGLGICRDLAGLARLELLRRRGISVSPPDPQPPRPGNVETSAAGDSAGPEELPEAAGSEISPSTDLDRPVEPPKDSPPEPVMEELTSEPAEMLAETQDNVLPFRPVGEIKPPALTPVENSAFNELARQLSARLDNADPGEASAPAGAAASERDATEGVTDPEAVSTSANDRPNWLTPPEPPARGQSQRDKALLDLLPAGVLIYRLDRLLYANPAFLKRIGYASLHALEQAGGLDALYVEPGVSSSSSTSEAGTPVTISADHGDETDVAPTTTAARLHTIAWDDDAALALICSEGPVDASPVPVPLPAVPETAAEPMPEPAPTAAGAADAEDLGAILDTTTEGIVMFDAEGHIRACNRSAEALFGYDGADFVTRNLVDLFAPEGQHGVFEYFAGVKSAGASSLLDHGRETLGRVRQGGTIPLSLTIGRTRADGPNFFAVFRDLSQSRKNESELQQARRLAGQAANAKADMLARISHELRAPLNAIIGFAEVMIGERFGAIGNERYAEYMKDIRASGHRVIAIIDDLHDLSQIETGKIDLSFTSQNLNELVESCVAMMQPQANRERIIIRTSLANTLPPVVADARALRQIALNLIGNSIHLAKAGGQVIVSTAMSDFGEVVLRVRDSGRAMNDNQVAAALEPFRTRGVSDQDTDASAVSLSLTKALVEANLAQFHIKPGPHTGTLVEVVFSPTMARV